MPGGRALNRISSGGAVASRLLASDLRPRPGQQCVACLAFEFGCNPCRDLWFKFPPCLGLDLGQTLCNRVWLPRDFLEGGFVFWFHPESEPFQPFGFSCLNEFALIFVLVILVHGLPLIWKHPCQNNHDFDATCLLSAGPPERGVQTSG